MEILGKRHQMLFSIGSFYSSLEKRMTVLYVFQFHSPLSRIGASSLSFITPSGFPVTRGTPSWIRRRQNHCRALTCIHYWDMRYARLQRGTKAVSDQTTISGFSSMAPVSLFRFSKFSLYVLYPPFQYLQSVVWRLPHYSVRSLFSSHFLFTK